VETWEWIAVGAAIGAGVILVVALAASFVTTRRRRSRLQQHRELHIRGLPWVALERYLEEWRQAETRFVSDPADATRAAERIVTRVLEERGYPVDGDAEERAAHIAADYPETADRYRHALVMLATSNGDQSTESLRKAMVDLRAVLEELLVREPVEREHQGAGY
jgi:hypothetical protein